MKLIYQPSVYVVASSAVDAGELRRFHDDEGLDPVRWMGEDDAVSPCDLLPELAGRLCYMSFNSPRPGGNKAYVQHIKESGHGSVLEHSSVTLILTGVSRSLTHELVRHRAGFGFSQLSQRYVDESKADFVVPPELHREVRAAEEHFKLNHPVEEMGGGLLVERWLVADQEDWRVNLTLEQRAGYGWIRSVINSQNDYTSAVQYLLEKIMKEMIEANVSRSDHQDRVKAGILSDVFDAGQRTAIRKKARQAARSLLPNCTETKVAVTANLRAWRHFCEMRANPAADAEMQRLAFRVCCAVQKVAPNVFDDFSQTAGESFCVETSYKKV